MKKIIFSAALLMGFAVVSFAGNPKGSATSTESPTEAKTTAQTSYYWYDVQYDAFGQPYVPAGSTPTQGERDKVEGDCELGNDKLCKVGYSNAQTLPINDPEAAPEQIQRAH